MGSLDQIKPWLPLIGPVPAALITGLIAYRVGYRNGRTAERTLALTIRRATPHLGSRVELRPFHPPDADWVKRYASYTTLYNKW